MPVPGSRVEYADGTFATRATLDPVEKERLQRTQAIHISPETIRAEAKRMDAGAAGGLGGSDYKSLRLWFSENDDLAADICVVINKILRADIPEEVRGLLRMSRGILRPLSSSSVFGMVLRRGGLRCCYWRCPPYPHPTRGCGGGFRQCDSGGSVSSTPPLLAQA